MTLSKNASKYILIVEDDLDINEAVVTILKEEGYQTKATSNGKEAIDFLNSTTNLPSLILLDMMMPIMPGLEFRRIQLQNPALFKIPTILFSAGLKGEDLSELHFNDFLKKPLDLDTLMIAVKKNIN